uniref:SH3 domain-containing protein n=1 Tax=Eptatretus burgeri TaxID=7764 RepID=A0A8C4N3T3_EPTBU
MHRWSSEGRKGSMTDGRLDTTAKSLLPGGGEPGEIRRAALLNRFPPQLTFQVDRPVCAAQAMDLSLAEGDLVGVIKQQDPMGSNNRWFVDNGTSQGFVYSSFLRPYVPRTDRDGDRSLTSSLTDPQTPTPGGSPPVSPLSASPRARQTLRPSASLDRGSCRSPRRCTRQTRPGSGWKRSEVEAGGKWQDPGAAAGGRCSYRKQSQQELDGNSRHKGDKVYYAVQPFEAKGSQEMGLHPWQPVTILQFHDGYGGHDWWLGESEGGRGLVPAACLARMEYT